MKKTPEKGFLGPLVADHLAGSSTTAQYASTSTSTRLSYFPVPNPPWQGNRIDPKEFDTKGILDTSKKRNRRRERRHKSASKQQSIDTPSSGSTPHSSPSIRQPNASTSARVAQEEGSVNKKTKSKSYSESRSPREHKFTYMICSVKLPLTGKVYRKRSKKHKYVNLDTFLGLTKTCVFETNNAHFLAAFEKLSLGPIENKTKRRKYFDITANQNAQPKGTVKETSKRTETIISRVDKNQHVQSVIVTEKSQSHVEIRQDISQGNVESAVKKRTRVEKRTQRKAERKNARKSTETFLPYISHEMAIIGEKKGELIRGFVRINPKNCKDAYVSNRDSAQSDYYITSVADRNRALDGDEVLLKLKPETSWQEGKQTAVVVHILKQVHPRVTVGNLKPDPTHFGYAIFHPRDKRMPTMKIAQLSWPQLFQTNPRAFENILLVAKLAEWLEPQFAFGVITEVLGLAGGLRIETSAILKEFCLDVTPFPPNMIQYLPKSKHIPPEELSFREDLRKECVFTIDPLTARDLDDAVSVKELPSGRYEVGVHISDASYYLPEDNPLDQMVSSKATTIYLVDSVYHMLPVELCLHCSLLPGEDKLAFSVFWEMNKDGEIFNTRFARTVVNSCSQLAYEHAQQMIEDPNKEFKKEELPPILNGFSAQDLSKTVNVLKTIAANLREARIRNGSLRIDQTKLLFSLNPSNGEPIDFIAYQNKESHRLIEEFMLLANISVAGKINDVFPDIAFLRCHEPPKLTMLAEAQKCLETCGMHIDISSSGSIHSGLRKYITNDYQGMCRGVVLNHIFAKPMTRARYFCAAGMENMEDYKHYALSVPIYTHFTSPIRRYADIMVHRLLAASLGYADKPKWDVDHVIAIAANCNIKKYNAKRAGEVSSELYLAHYIEKNQPYPADCVVIDVKDRSFDAIVLKTGSVIRVHQQKCENNPAWNVEAIASQADKAEGKQEQQKKVLRLTLDFPQTTKIPEPHRMVVEMFTVVKVLLTRVSNTNKLDAFLLRPVLSRTFESRTNKVPSAAI